MVAKMPSQSLQQTSAIIASRAHVEHLLAEINQKSKIAWERGENINLLKQQISQVNKIVEANKNYSSTHYESVREHVPCDMTKMALNCPTCKTIAASISSVGSFRSESWAALCLAKTATTVTAQLKSINYNRFVGLYAKSNRP